MLSHRARPCDCGQAGDRWGKGFHRLVPDIGRKRSQGIWNICQAFDEPKPALAATQMACKPDNPAYWIGKYPLKLNTYQQ